MAASDRRRIAVQAARRASLDCEHAFRGGLPHAQFDRVGIGQRHAPRSIDRFVLTVRNAWHLDPSSIDTVNARPIRLALAAASFYMKRAGIQLRGGRSMRLKASKIRRIRCLMGSPDGLVNPARVVGVHDAKSRAAPQGARCVVMGGTLRILTGHESLIAQSR